MSKDEEVAAKQAMVDKFADEILAFKDFCAATAEDEKGDEISWEEQDFFALSLGFFVAKGVSHVDAWDLAIICRYDFHYWC